MISVRGGVVRQLLDSGSAVVLALGTWITVLNQEIDLFGDDAHDVHKRQSGQVRCTVIPNKMMDLPVPGFMLMQWRSSDQLLFQSPEGPYCAWSASSCMRGSSPTAPGRASSLTLSRALVK